MPVERPKTIRIPETWQFVGPHVNVVFCARTSVLQFSGDFIGQRGFLECQALIS